LALEVKLNHGANVGGRLKVNLRLWVQTTKAKQDKKRFNVMVIFYSQTINTIELKYPSPQKLIHSKEPH
jgi:hypothetical protein